MKIQYVSDIHAEFFEDFNSMAYQPSLGLFEALDEADVIIFAGDIHHSGKQAARWINQNSKGKLCFAVLGNHEYYASSAKYGREVDAFKEEAREDVILLDNDHMGIFNSEDGETFCFYGGTMWTDFSVGDFVLDRLSIINSMNDYKKIRLYKNKFGETRKVIPEDFMRENKLFMKGLSYFNSWEKKVKRIVVSHHDPMPPKPSSRSFNSEIKGAYHNDVRPLLSEENNIDLWISGHTHEPKDNKFGKTRFVSNPHGYFGHENLGYSNKLIEL